MPAQSGGQTPPSPRVVSPADSSHAGWTEPHGTSAAVYDAPGRKEGGREGESESEQEWSGKREKGRREREKEGRREGGREGRREGARGRKRALRRYIGQVKRKNGKGGTTYLYHYVTLFQLASTYHWPDNTFLTTSRPILVGVEQF